jgi:hypothetical protein
MCVRSLWFRETSVAEGGLCAQHDTLIFLGFSSDSILFLVFLAISSGCKRVGGGRWSDKVAVV